MKLLVADDHTLFREGLRYILTQLDPAVTILEAADHKAARALIEAHPDADLALIDLHMPGEGGASVLDMLRADALTVPVVVLSASEDRREVRAALDAGAMGFIPKSESSEVMLGALRLVLAGGVYVPPMLLGGSIGAATDAHGLTPRQREVLQRLVQGQSNKQIGRELGLSLPTVKAHVAAIFKALHVANRTQVARAAERAGLLPASDPSRQA